MRLRAFTKRRKRMLRDDLEHKSEATAAEPPSQMAMTMKSLAGALDKTTDAAATLVNKLAPVLLLQDPRSEKPADPERPPVCPLVVELEVIVSRLDQLTESLVNVRDRCEL